jgi:hypothetical protein
MTEWTYKVVTVNTLHDPTIVEWTLDEDFGGERIEKMLASMGTQGWQLVAFVPARPAGHMYKHPVSGAESWLDANPWLYHAIFKKPAETSEERKQRVHSERLARRAEPHRAAEKF